jgi:hypothetical protein
VDELDLEPEDFNEGDEFSEVEEASEVREIYEVEEVGEVADVILCRDDFTQDEQSKRSSKKGSKKH